MQPKIGTAIQNTISYDQELWKLFKNGDNNALSTLYSSYFEQLYNYGYKFSLDTLLVEDCIQELFIKLMKNRSGLTDPDSVKSYLFASLRSHIFDKLKQSKKYHAQDLDESAVFIAELHVEQVIIEKELVSERQKKLSDAVDKLTPRQREAIFLKYQEGLSYPEIAEILSLTQKAAYKLIGRAMEVLRSLTSILFLFLISILGKN